MDHLTALRTTSLRAQPRETPHSFATELAAMRPWLKQRALCLVHCDAAADDLVQDTIERALTRQRFFRSGTNMQGWTASILRNLFIDGWRRTALQLRDDVDELADEPQEEHKIGPTDVFSIEDVRLSAEQLSPRERAIFVMAHFENATYQQISTRFRMRISTVGTCLHRTRAKLRSILEAAYATRLKQRDH